MPRRAAALLALLQLAACEPTLTVGEWTCSEDGSASSPADRSSAIALPWATGFENRFCDYTEQAGFCYSDPRASYELVTAPVHSGRHAVAFKVDSEQPDGNQARCVRQGVLPRAAYYGAWYLMPAHASNRGNWNLWHFRGGDPRTTHGLWDVSLVNGSGGAPELVLYGFLDGRTRRATSPKPVPIGSWFHLELYLARAADASGEVALYLDSERIVEARNLVTDDTDWGQWYVGNLATELAPADSTLYVDDITIGVSR